MAVKSLLSLSESCLCSQPGLYHPFPSSYMFHKHQTFRLVYSNESRKIMIVKKGRHCVWLRAVLFFSEVLFKVFLQYVCPNPINTKLLKPTRKQKSYWLAVRLWCKWGVALNNLIGQNTNAVLRLQNVLSIIYKLVKKKKSVNAVWGMM